MSDEELDALFQRGAAAYPDEMPAAAWARMETKLDEAARTQQLRRKIGRFFAGELLLIAFLLWQVVRLTTPAPTLKTVYPQHDALSVTNRITTTTATEAASDKLSTASVPHRSNTAPALSISAPAPGVNGEVVHRANPAPVPSPDHNRSAPTSLLPTQPTALPTLARAAKANRLNAENSLTPARAARPHHTSVTRRALAKATTTKGNTGITTLAREQITRSRQHLHNDSYQVVSLAGKKASNKQQVKYSQLFAKASGRFAPAEAKHKQATTLLTTYRLAQSAKASEVDSLARRITLPLVAQHPLPDLLRSLAVQQAAADTTQPPRRRAPRPPYRVVVGLLAGPSFSGVRTAQTAQLGADYGLTMEYRFSTKWRVRAGLLSSQKHYQAASTDYEAPAAWQWFAGTYDVTANCRITEIPLDLRYDVLSKPAYTLFTSLGVNSLLMRNERYSYDWMAGGQTFTKSAQVLKGSNHFLSVLNVSVGFEKPLGQRWSAQVEPFWQLPLGGVGAGKVRLTSAGASFSLKFGLLK